ncbi:hypothetical protein ABLE68_08990 [Nocardioides sp. CN2-186]|uniref:hypothetical protein n=1 Tax=Nocardioides tweenelious TaxID=3156607 RepID=UPI0032B3AFBC
MTIHTRYRRIIAAAVGALIAPMALVAVTAVQANAVPSQHKHEIYMYKVEKSLRLSGVGADSMADSPSQWLSCNPFDYALDGMWSVKSVDQYNPPVYDPDDDSGYPTTSTAGGLYNDKRDVWTLASYPDTSDGSKWNFRFDNRAYGDAQVKIFVTCIRHSVESSNNHSHDVVVTPAFGSTFMTGHHAWTDRDYWDSSSTWFCAPDQYFVAPGFDFGPGYSPENRMLASYPTNGGLSWAWEFASNWSHPDQNVSFYGKCISRKTSLNGHRHGIGMKHLPGVNFSDWKEALIPQGDPKETQYSCDQDFAQLHGYKAMVGWYWLGNHWEHNWFLGMEPRPKTRAFYWWNWDASSAQVKFGALCINSRTSNPLV